MRPSPHLHRNSLLLSVLIALLASLGSLPAAADSSIVNSVDDSDDGLCDSAHCSLREAINHANANPGADTISFDLPGPGPYTIMPSSLLPSLSDGGTTIDGTTQSGYAGTPLIMLQPDHPATPGQQLTGVITLLSSGNVVRGMSIASFSFLTEANAACWGYSGAGGGIVVLSGTGNLLEGNYIGLSPSGAALGNDIGIYVHMDAPGQVIQDNVISANRCGLYMWGDSQLVLSNRIGTDPTGTFAMGNYHHGVVVVSINNQIGRPGSGNIISGHDTFVTSSGIFLNTIPGVSSQNFIQSNKIGTDITGTAPIPNSYGIWYIDGDRGIVGGADPSEGNVVAYNQSNGIEMEGFNHFVMENEIFNNGLHGVQNEKSTYLSRNSIYENAGLGIRVPYSSAQDVPVLEPLANAGSIKGTSCMFCLIEIFIADPDPSGAGEGKDYLGLTDANFDGDFFMELPIGLKSCDRLTATATDQSNLTSEFALNVIVPPCVRLNQLNWVLIPIIPLFIGVLVGVFNGRRRGIPAGPSIIRGGFLGGGGGLLLLGAMWMLPFVEFSAPVPRSLPLEPTPIDRESLLAGLDLELTPVSPNEPDGDETDSKATPTASPTSTATPTEELGMCTFEASVNIFCRTGSDTRFKAIDSFTPGQKGPVVGMSSDGFYWYVLGPLSNLQCTVPSAERFGIVTGDCSAVPQFTPMPTPVDSPTPTATITPTLSREG